MSKYITIEEDKVLAFEVMNYKCIYNKANSDRKVDFFA